MKKKFGVPPEKFLDYLTLIGDQIDNIPGVDKVGPKTAAKWIEKYGSLEGVLAHADEISGLAGENLRKHARLAAQGAPAPHHQARRAAAEVSISELTLETRCGEAARAIRALRLQILA